MLEHPETADLVHILLDWSQTRTLTRLRDARLRDALLSWYQTRTLTGCSITRTPTEVTVFSKPEVVRENIVTQLPLGSVGTSTDIVVYTKFSDFFFITEEHRRQRVLELTSGICNGGNGPVPNVFNVSIPQGQVPNVGNIDVEKVQLPNVGNVPVPQGQVTNVGASSTIPYFIVGGILVVFCCTCTINGILSDTPLNSIIEYMVSKDTIPLREKNQRFK